MNYITDIRSKKDMEKFCQRYSKLDNTTYMKQVELEENILELCYEMDYHDLATKYFPLDKSIELYHTTNSELFLKAYIYCNNMLHRFEETILIIEKIDHLELCNENSILNINIALDMLGKHDNIIEFTEDTNNTQFLMQRAYAFQKRGDLEEAYQIYKTLRNLKLSPNESNRLNFRFAELFFLRGEKAKLLKILNDLEMNYIAHNESNNITTYEIAKYYSFLNLKEKCKDYLIKAANYYAYGDVSVQYKVKAIKKLKEKFNILTHQSFEQNLPHEAYVKLKDEFYDCLEKSSGEYIVIL